MQNDTFLPVGARAIAATLLAVVALAARADAITDWSLKCADVITEARLGTPPATRAMAIIQTAAYDAAVAARGRADRPVAASVDAAIAAAHRVTITKLFPAQQAAVEATYQAALATIADGPARAAGIAAGEKAAAAVLAARADDGAAVPETYRPHTSAGAYVPTATPAVPQWVQRKPWLMASAAQFRPGPPPPLTSDAWAREFDEVKTFGGRSSSKRSAEQTEIARFWEYSLPAIYHGVMRSIALAPGRDTVANARLFAAAAQAMDDAVIAVFDAKYHYNFWRPVTAIRNGDIDGHDGTARDSGWAPLVDTPMHPEYPSAHSIIAAALGTVLKAEIGDGPMPALTTTSPTAKGATRRWTSIDEFVREVGEARVHAGIHYRFSTEVSLPMGERIGALAVARHLRAPH